MLTTETKVKVDGATVITVEEVPVPLNGTVCGLPVPLDVTVRAPVRVPIAVGVKEMLTEQVVFWANDVVHEFALMAKSPLTPKLIFLIEPLFAVTPTLWARLVVPCAWLVNV